MMDDSLLKVIVESFCVKRIASRILFRPIAENQFHFSSFQFVHDQDIQEMHSVLRDDIKFIWKPFLHLNNWVNVLVRNIRGHPVFIHVILFLCIHICTLTSDMFRPCQYLGNAIQRIYKSLPFVCSNHEKTYTLSKPMTIAISTWPTPKP